VGWGSRSCHSPITTREDLPHRRDGKLVLADQQGGTDHRANHMAEKRISLDVQSKVAGRRLAVRPLTHVQLSSGTYWLVILGCVSSKRCEIVAADEDPTGLVHRIHIEVIGDVN
jgi:hypothetical protein